MSEISNFVASVDQAFIFILGVAFFFLIGITAVMVYFVIRYRRSQNPESTHIEGNNTLEVIWTVIPAILVMLMFYYGWVGYHPQEEAPANAMKIKSIARMWNFSYEYANGRMTDTLYVPQGRPVQLDLKALDVIHSYYIPAFRIKKDMVPGRETMMWFNAGQVGEYQAYCAEYCGLNHSYMLSTVKVIPANDFDKWYNDTAQVVAKSATVDARSGGMALVKKLGCVACHSVDGVNLVGPTFKGLYGSSRKVKGKGGEMTVTADDAYITESVLDPAAKVVDGFSSGVMLSYKDQLKDGDIEQIIAYLKSLSK
jgi:cytochrome c oxidase subunit 2